MHHAKQLDLDGYFEIVAEMNDRQTTRHGRVSITTGTLHGEAVTAILHESEGIGQLIY